MTLLRQAERREVQGFGVCIHEIVCWAKWIHPKSTPTHHRVIRAKDRCSEGCIVIVSVVVGVVREGFVREGVDEGVEHATAGVVGVGFLPGGGVVARETREGDVRTGHGTHGTRGRAHRTQGARGGTSLTACGRQGTAHGTWCRTCRAGRETGSVGGAVGAGRPLVHAHELVLLLVGDGLDLVQGLRPPKLLQQA